MKLAVVVLTALTGAAHADDADAPVRALLADPAQLAAWLSDRDPVVESARARFHGASELAAQTRTLPNPVLSLGAGGFVVGATNKGSGLPGDENPRLGLGQTTNFQLGIGELIELGKRGPRQAAADLRTREAGELAVGALGGRLGDATTALGKLTYVAARRDVVAANLAAAKQLRDTEKVRLDNKDLSPLEYGRIELDTDELELLLARAESEVTSASAVCTATLYAPCLATGLDASALDAAAPLPATPPAEAAIEARPVRQASRLEQDALGNDATLAHNRRIPDPTLGLGYLYDNLTVAGNQHQQLMITLGFALPLFDRGDHDAAAARANAHALAAEDRAAVREQHGLVDALVAQRATLETTLGRLETQAVPKSTQIIAQTRKAFDLGQARLADLLLVERAHRDLLLEVLDTRFDLFTVRAQLRQALGLDDAIARTVAGRHT